MSGNYKALSSIQSSISPYTTTLYNAIIVINVRQTEAGKAPFF